MTAPEPHEYRSLDARQRDAQAIYDQRLAAAKAERRADWPAERKRIMSSRFEIEQAARTAGEDVYWPTPPPTLDAPTWWLEGVTVPPVVIEAAPRGPRAMPGHDALGRPLKRLLTAEEQLAAAEAKPEGRAAHALRRIVEAQS